MEGGEGLDVPGRCQSPETTKSFSRIRRDRSESPRHRNSEREAMFTRLGRKEKGVFNRLGGKGGSVSARSSDSKPQRHGMAKGKQRAVTKATVQEKRNTFPKSVTTKERLHREQKCSRKVKIVEEDTGSQDRKNKSQSLKKTTYPNHGCAKKRISSHPRFKSESRHVKRAPECMRISGFMHEITNPELIKRLHDNIPKSVDEIMRETTAFLRGEVAASNQVRKKTLSTWKKQETRRKQNFDKRGNFRNQQRSERRRDRFTLLTKSPKEILALDKGKFKTPPPMSTLVEKRNNNKLCEFHREAGHNTDECMHLKRKIEELIKDGKLSHVIKELKQGGGKDQPKAAKKREASGKDKALAILMVQPWKRVTQSFSPDLEISFPPLGDEDGTEGPMIIEAEIEGHFIHRIYVDGGSTLEILYEHCFNRLRPKVKSQMVPATAPLIGFSGEIIWPIGQISLSVKIGDIEHSTSTWMNFVVVRSPSPYSRIIERPGTIAIGSTLTEDGRKELCDLLGHNLDIFAWKSTDMIWVPRHIVEHRLNLREGCPLVRQKKRSQAPERNKDVCGLQRPEQNVTPRQGSNARRDEKGNHHNTLASI
ncbi:hypothetical protein Tco_1068687 [Tanacetum coccineum]|uniref:Reverse transcriptase domain-containing protein n=1 Tax=Tanacetum coccineum TaxID=301880 RepID=A0ABQ5HI97_9ASTR